MSDRQLDLHGDETPVGETDLSFRQRDLLAHVRASYDGVTADEAGAFLHSRKLTGGHPVDARCRWCGRDGKAALDQLTAHGLLTKPTGLTWRTADQEPAG